MKLLPSNTSPVDILALKEDASRLLDEEDELRKISPIEGALGKNHSDYHQLWYLFTQIVDRAQAMNADPTAFQSRTGQYNEKLIATWTKMISTAKSILEALNRMRNADRMVGLLLEDHTKAFTQACCIELGMEIKSIIEGIDAGDSRDGTVLRLKKLMYRRIPEIFLKSASATLTHAKTTYNVLM